MQDPISQYHKLDSGPSTNVLLKEIAQLQRNIDNLVLQNCKTLSKITLIQHQFQHTLYQAKKIPGKQITFKKEILLRQIDKLLQEKAFLDRKLHFFTVQQQQKGQYKNNCTLRQSNQYTFLRTVWTKFQSSQANDALDKIQQLNKAVCTFKNNIIGITNKQKVQPSMPQLIKATQYQYNKLKQKYEQANMLIQDLTGKLSNKNQLVLQLKQKYQMQKNQNEKLKNQQKKYQNSIIKFRLDMVKIDQDNFRLSNQIKQLKRYITKLEQQKQGSNQEINNQNSQLSSEIQHLSFDKSQIGQFVFLNPTQKLRINLKIQQYLQNQKLSNQINTFRTLKEITQFLQGQKEQEAETYSQVFKVPLLPLSQKEKASTNDQFSERTITNKFISKKQSLNASGPRTQRKLLTTRNQVSDIQDPSKFASTRVKKFSRTPLNGSNTKNETQREDNNKNFRSQERSKQEQVNEQQSFVDGIKITINSSDQQK